MIYGLDDEIIRQLKGIFARYENIERVVIYGSRAKGNYRKGSDIDLTLQGEGLTLGNSVYPVMDEIEELMLPYTFDISVYSQIDNEGLLDHIKRVGKVFYERSGAEFEKDKDGQR